MIKTNKSSLYATNIPILDVKEHVILWYARDTYMCAIIGGTYLSSSYMTYLLSKGKNKLINCLLRHANCFTFYNTKCLIAEAKYTAYLMMQSLQS
jgi:hypothetical protein